jgi:GMP synthase-like glutamine amidotransferase
VEREICVTRRGRCCTVPPKTSKATKYTIKQADGLIISGGHHMMHISQWMKSGGGKLLSDSGMQTFS